MVLAYLNKSYSFLLRHKVDVVFAIFYLILTSYYAVYVYEMKVPIHDGAVYLLNARSWLYNTEIYQNYRPQFISWLISGIWSLTSENWVTVKYLQCTFTMAAGIILYALIRKYKAAYFAFGVSALTMLNATVFTVSTQITPDGIALFFLVLTLYLLKTQKESYWFLAGITIGLTFATRYPIVVQALAILIIESIISKNPRLVIKSFLGAAPVIIMTVLAVYLKTGLFQTALPKDSVLTVFLSPFYITNSIDIWGLVIILVPVCFLYKRTYKDKFNYAFIVWLIVGIIFWSASPTNHQYRFTIHFTPAVYFLSILGLESFLIYLRERTINMKSRISN